MELLLPTHPVIKKYVSSIYVFEKESAPVQYTSYPSPNVAVALLKNATVTDTLTGMQVMRSAGAGYIALACPRLYNLITMSYPEMVDEIAINFTPTGFVTFTQCAHQERLKYFLFNGWAAGIPQLFDSVFAINSNAERLAITEAFLLQYFMPAEDEPIINEVIGILSDFSQEYTMQQIAGKTGLHYKDMYRRFKKLVGCSPAHYRKIVRFRQSVYAKLNSADLARLTDLCYTYDYTDQSYFIKQFQELTGESPKPFFKGISQFGRDQIFWKFS